MSPVHFLGLQTPIWMSFAVISSEYYSQSHPISHVLFKVAEQIKERNTNDKIKVAFILTISPLLVQLLNLHMDMDSECNLFKDASKLLEETIQLVSPEHLRPLLQLVPPHKQMYTNQEINKEALGAEGGYNHIKIIWNHLKKIGPRDAANLIYANFEDLFKKRYFCLPAITAKDVLEILAAIWNIKRSIDGFYTLKDVGFIINDL